MYCCDWCGKKDMFIVPCGVNVDQMVALLSLLQRPNNEQGVLVGNKYFTVLLALLSEYRCIGFWCTYINTKRVCRCSSVWLFFCSLRWWSDIRPKGGERWTT